MKPKIIENILPNNISNIIKEKLINTSGWQIVHDGLPLEVFSTVHQASDGGMLLFSHKKDEENTFHELNFYADMILRLVLEKCVVTQEHAIVPEFSNIELHRHLWNYYNGNSKGVEHTDKDLDDFYSIVYYVNTTEGGTFIIDDEGNKFFSPSVAGNCVIFPSKLLHWGTGAPINGHRFALNILFKGDRFN